MRSSFQTREGVRYHPAALIIMKQKKRISKTESIKQILKLLRKGYATTDITREIASKYDDDFWFEFDGNEYRCISEGSIWDIYVEEIKQTVEECYDLKLDNILVFS